MEGVLVSARKDAATVTITVVSDAQGHYGFPATRLDPGHYTLQVRAAGYELDGAVAASWNPAFFTSASTTPCSMR